MSETAFATEVLQWARVYKWRAFHVRNSGYGGRTFVQGDKGAPDLLMVRDTRWIAAELKVGKAGTVAGDPRIEQLEWLWALEKVGAEIYVWRPADLPDILRVLSGSS